MNYHIKWTVDDIGVWTGVVMLDGKPVSDAETIQLLKPLEHTNETIKEFEDMYGWELEDRYYFVPHDSYALEYEGDMDQEWSDVAEEETNEKLYEINSISTGEIVDNLQKEQKEILAEFEKIHVCDYSDKRCICGTVEIPHYHCTHENCTNIEPVYDDLPEYVEAIPDIPID